MLSLSWLGNYRSILNLPESLAFLALDKLGALSNTFLYTNEENYV